MAQRLSVFLSGGSGQVELSPNPDDSGFYDTGTDVTVTLSLDSGFTFVNWVINGAEVSTSLTVVVTIGRSDVLLTGTATGAATAPFTYGIRYWDEYVDDQNRKSRITIEEKDYEGESERVTIKNPTYQIGEFDGEPIKTFITSRLEFTFQIAKNEPDLSGILTLDPRKYRVKWYRDYTDDTTYGFIWIGYLKTDFLSRPEYRDTYDFDVVATDGLSDLEGYLVQVPSLNFTSAANLIARLLNLTFKDGLPIRECVRVFETRMETDDFDSVWSQFTVNADTLYEDEVRFQEEGSLLIFNPGKNVRDSIETMVTQFVTRVFQWNGYWYIVRVQEYAKDTLKFNEFSNVGDSENYFSVANDQTFDCIGNVVRNGKVSYTRFNAVLKLGSLNRPENRSIITDDFGPASWYNPAQGRPTSAPGQTLRRWDYINAVKMDGNRGEEFARIERVSNPHSGEQGEFVRIWGTANGLSDTNLSGLRFNWIDFGGGAVRDADVITIQAKFQILRRGSGDPNIPPANSHVVGMKVKIGSSFLEYDGNTTFSWSTTPTNEIMTFPVTNTQVFNVIDIQDIVAPESGQVELTLYQLVTLSGSRHRYVVDWEDISVDLSRNDALLYKERLAKGITDEPFEHEYDKYETYIGDAITPLSSSAILLKDVAEVPVSEGWQREEETEDEPLLGIVLQDLINTYGKNNYSYPAVIKESDSGSGIDFSKGINYKGRKQVFTAARLDDRSGIWSFEFYEL